jgi:mRNA-degrading endonuclease RelE of RelBE toxin-antitoxin system
MKIRVELDPQVADFVRALAPDPRKRLRTGLRGLEQEKGDIKQLEADLAGYARLRVGGYRVIVRFYADGARRVARCVFAEKRAVV